MSDGGLRRFAQPDLSWAGLGFRQLEHSAVDLGPFQPQDLASPAARQEEQANDVGLASSMRSSNDSSPAADRKEKATVDLGLDRALDHEPLARPDPAAE